MTARIRGHYRIDSCGRVEPVGDVNSSLQSYVFHPPMRRDPAAEQRARLMKICIAGLSLFCVGLALMASLPQIQRLITSSESARMRSIRRTLVHAHPGLISTASDQHGHHRLSDH